MKFKFIDYSGDIKFIAYGETIEKCFENAALALFSAILDITKVKEKFIKEGKIESESLENLLHDFLSELIFISETENLVFKKFEIKINKNEKFFLNYKAYGDKSENYEIYTYIKGITYHDLRIENKNNIWECEVLCDT